MTIALWNRRPYQRLADALRWGRGFYPTLPQQRAYASRRRYTGLLARGFYPIFLETINVSETETIERNIVVEELELKFAEELVKLKQPNGSSRTYTIREFDGVKRDEYDTAIGKRFEWSGEGKIAKINDFRNTESLLLSMCLWDDNNRLVPETEIKKWPDSVRKALYTKAAKLNGLDEQAKEQAKNG